MRRRDVEGMVMLRWRRMIIVMRMRKEVISHRILTKII
jgi:hypothetical protein